MASPRVRLTLDLELDREPIAGTLRRAGKADVPFSGWIQLVSLLQTAATSDEVRIEAV
jgi:hypothetical protein